MDPKKITQNWLREFVIKQGLCPFAHEVYSKNKILYTVLSFLNADDLVSAFKTCATQITTESAVYTTALIVIDSGLEVFENYMAVYHSLEELLATLELDEAIQLASFHPDYQFHGTEPDAISNYTNRSPFPLIHLLRTDEVEAAIAAHPDIASVPAENIKKMHEIGEQGILKILNGLN